MCCAGDASQLGSVTIDARIFDVSLGALTARQ